MRSTKKGFTLIELLAVIVILAVIALIATPQLLKVIDTAKQGTAESSALGYIDAVEKQVAVNIVNNNKNITDGLYTDLDDLKENYKVNVKGKEPSSGWIKIEKGMVKDYSFVIDNYLINYDETNLKVTSEKIESKKKEVVQSATHKGIVYLDPTDLSKKCTLSDVETNYATSGKKDTDNNNIAGDIKTGCMKWYIFDDSGNNYKLILDHNTTAGIKWNDDNINVEYKDSNLKTVIDSLVETTKWEAAPRLITAYEINDIVGGVTTWDAKNGGTWFFFEGIGTRNQTSLTYNTSNRSGYDWLYNNLYKCKTDSTDYGCTIEDSNLYIGYGTTSNRELWGYWTSTLVGTTGHDYRVWRVIKSGALHGSNANDAYNGIRPVITLSKNLIS